VDVTGGGAYIVLREELVLEQLSWRAERIDVILRERELQANNTTAFIVYI
jgi:hypothetical protein